MKDHEEINAPKRNTMCVDPLRSAASTHSFARPTQLLRQCGLSPTRTVCAYVSAAHAVILTFLCAGCADANHAIQA